MKRILLTATVLMGCGCLNAQTDTLRLSSSYTTHVIFTTDITYADLSNSRVVAAKIVEQNRNMLALKAKMPFDEPTSVSALESNGRMHTYIVVYDPSPEELVIDTREAREDTKGRQSRRPLTDDHVSMTGRADAPSIRDVYDSPKRLHHLGDRDYGILFLCEDIVSYSDITYLVLSIRNSSGISYETPDATFVVESRRKGRRSVAAERTVFPQSRYGSLSAPAGETSRMVYSFDKLTLSRDQVLKIYVYEDGGSRNFSIAASMNDVNKAGRRWIAISGK